VTASKGAQGAPENTSVYDFLYHDSRRIASFLAQFDENGLLTGLRRGENLTKGTRRGYKVEVGGSVAVLGGGNLGFERSPGESGGESAERIYDPLWANAREFLDAASAREMIKRDISTARIGQFVLVSGSIVIADLAPLKPMWNMPVVKKLMFSEAGGAQQNNSNRNRQSRRASGQSSNDTPTTEAELGVALLPHLHHSGLLLMMGDGFATWSSVVADALVSTLPDLALKHGAKIAGEWSMLGILDARPDDASAGLTIEERLNLNLMVGIPSTSVVLAEAARVVMGRPSESYGVTPLLVFREIG